MTSSGAAPPSKRVSIRVDVDTHTGLRDGVPLLLDLLARLTIRASFFVTMGPDNSGRAVRRFFTRRGFARKMARTNALRTYGLRTILSGTLLPSRPVGRGFPELLRRVESGGHECGIHGWDHVLWHDRLERLGTSEVEAELRRASDAFAEATGHPPAGTVAPAWRATTASLTVQDDLPFEYASDCRGHSPFRAARAGGPPHRLLQIPSTLRTLDEMIGEPSMTPEQMSEDLTRALRPSRLNVFTVHAEVEGRRYASLFEAILRRWLREGWTFEPLRDVAARTLASPGGASGPRVAVCRLDRSEVAGRAGWVSVQGKPE